MRFRRAVFIGAGACLLWAAAVTAYFVATQPTRTKPAPAQSAAGHLTANLNQVMRGVFFNNANVIFFAQSNDPTAVKPAPERAAATDPLAGSYNGWAAVENSALTISEAASLLTIPGRVCSNGKVVPVTSPEWTKGVEELRAAGLAAYQAAQSKSNEKMLAAGDQVGAACNGCHDRYRQREGADRCS